MAHHNNTDGTKRPDGASLLTGTPPLWVSIISDYNGELFDFMARRLAKDARMMRELHDCESLNDVSGVHAKWLQETLRDYSDEATKLMALPLKPSTPPVHEG